LLACGLPFRARIIGAAARLIYERGVAGTTLEDVRTAAEASGSQVSHYFAALGYAGQLVEIEAVAVAGDASSAQ
jgi:Bacterial regulatory proteins, tetR family